MFGHAVHYVDWTDFVINCLELPCPDADDLLELKHKYRELDTAKRNDPDQECTAEGKVQTIYLNGVSLHFTFMSAIMRQRVGNFVSLPLPPATSPGLENTKSVPSGINFSELTFRKPKTVNSQNGLFCLFQVEEATAAIPGKKRVRKSDLNYILFESSLQNRSSHPTSRLVTPFFFHLISIYFQVQRASVDVNIFQFTEALKAVQSETYTNVRSTSPESKMTLLEKEQFLNEKIILLQSGNSNRYRFVRQVLSKFLPTYFCNTQKDNKTPNVRLFDPRKKKKIIIFIFNTFALLKKKKNFNC